VLAQGVAASHPFFRLSEGNPKNHLHHQRYRKPAHAAAQGAQKSGKFPSNEAATKLIYLALRNITKRPKNPPITWKLAATQFAIRFGERFFAADAA